MVKGEGKNEVISDIEGVRKGKKGPKGGILGGENNPFGWLEELAVRLRIPAEHYRKVFGKEPEVKGGNNRERR